LPELLAIDARGAADGVTAWTRVGGVALVARAVRRAGREGWREVTVITTEPARAERALAERPAAGVRVVFAEEAPHGARVVAALASYEDERRLYASLRKSVVLDGAVAYYVMRPLARLGTRALVDTRVTPDQVTLAALVVGLTAAAAAARGVWAAAGALAWLAATVDCIDGELARLRIEGSRRGEWLDSLADDVSTFGLLLGMSVGLGVPAWGALGALLGAATTGKLYYDLSSLGLPIDAAQYPWFFGKPSERKPPARGLARAVYLASFLFQRDAYITVVAVALALGAPWVAFLSLFGGIAFLTLLLLAHIAVTHATRR
jgi:phosphatidylglycerophosphate synthase